MGQIDKSRFWACLGYPENMIDDWMESVSDLISIPYAYTVHDKDLQKDGDDRKIHVHFILAFTNTTTKKHAQEVIELLSQPGKKAFMPVQAVINVRKSYDYLIHDTDECRKKGKYQYPKEDRVTGNGFDIGVYEQVSVERDFEMYRELVKYIKDNGIWTLIQLDDCIVNEFDSAYLVVLKKHTFHLKAYLDDNYHRLLRSGVVKEKEKNDISEKST